jgi:exonuclease SbcC
MRIESIRLRGIGPFKREFFADFSEMRGLVAITGANGAGKSTLLEVALPGAMFRQTPTRGSLVDLSTARDAFVEAKLVNGQSWTVRHLIDSVSKKSEALVLDANGVPALTSSKVKEYDDFAANHWPAPEVLLSTIFGAQGSGGFLAAKPAERKAILLRVLGVERLERLATEAREKLKAAKAQLDTTAARMADEAARGGDLAELERVLAGARHDLEAAEQHGRVAQAQLDAATAEEQRIKLIEQQNAAVVRSRDAIDARVAEARAKLRSVEERIGNNRAVLADAEQIRDAVEESGRLERKMAALHADSAMADADANRLIEPWADIEQRKGALQVRVERTRARLRDADAIQQAKAAIGHLSNELGEARAEVAATTLALEELHATRIAGADERIGDLRYALTTAAEQQTYDATHQAIHDGLDKDDVIVEAAKAIPSRASALRERLMAARDCLAVVERQHVDAARLAARADDLAGAEDELVAAERELADLETGRVAAARAAHEKRREAENLASQAKWASEQFKALASVAAKAAPLANAEARLAELEPQATALRADVALLTEERKAFETLEPVPPAPDVASLRAALKRWQDEAIQGNRTVSLREGQLEAAKASAARRAELEQLEQQQLAEVADWTRVASDLGKDGLQALEIDAAGPELTGLTNELLHSCHGPRFTARVETQRASADGKKVLEGCDVMVLDTVQGREASGETFSGGERVILAEALALAITVLACRRSGLSDVSLVRDESGAALDPGNARVYVAMLRKAVEMIGARHCLLVSHMPEVQELCDHRIEVGA